MFQVSKTTPAYYLTSVTHDRLPIFKSDTIKEVVCRALDEARRSAGLRLFSYVIMPDHTHIITDSAKKISETLRFTNGIVAKRVIDYLKENGFESSLAKLRVQLRDRQHRHSVFQHHSNAFQIFGEDNFRQKVNYIHLNPVRAGLVENMADYRFSSFRLWKGQLVENEPLLTDHSQIRWRAAA